MGTRHTKDTFPLFVQLSKHSSVQCGFIISLPRLGPGALRIPSRLRRTGGEIIMHTIPLHIGDFLAL